MDKPVADKPISTSWIPSDSADPLKPRRQCKAKSKRSQVQCKRTPPPGADVCASHGGKAPQVRAKAAERVAEQELLATVKTLGIREVYPDIDPGAALLEEIRVTHAHVSWLRAQVAELSPSDLTWGTIQHEEGVGPEGPIDKTTEKSEPSVWYVLYVREREHLVKVSAAALRAGIEERRIRMAESQGQQVAGVLRQIFAALHLTSVQQELLPTIVPQALRQLTGEGA